MIPCYGIVLIFKSSSPQIPSLHKLVCRYSYVCTHVEVQSNTYATCLRFRRYVHILYIPKVDAFASIVASFTPISTLIPAASLSRIVTTLLCTQWFLVKNICRRTAERYPCYEEPNKQDRFHKSSTLKSPVMFLLTVQRRKVRRVVLAAGSSYFCTTDRTFATKTRLGTPVVLLVATAFVNELIRREDHRSKSHRPQDGQNHTLSETRNRP